MKTATFDKRIDGYIIDAADFAKPILEHLRQVMHEACPEVEETIKWGFPHFEYRGSILCSMASFKQHCAFGFWLGAIMKDPHDILDRVGEKTSMGFLGKIKSMKDLPSKKILIQYVKDAMELTEIGAKKEIQKTKKIASKEVEVPAYFLAALKKNKKAFSTFKTFSNSNRKDYVEWITEAKTTETKNKRMATAIEWLAEGKSRNWKYMKS
jgi:uncharacterized protein YdeI (YjbR/CyaY-like superfamily)